MAPSSQVAARIRQQTGLAIEAQSGRIMADLPSYLVQRLNAGSAGISNGVRAFGDAIDRGFLQPGPRAAIHERAAALATRTVVEAYTEGSPFGKRVNQDNVYRPPNFGYRNPVRDSGGKLLAALEIPGVVALATPDGVSFMAGQGELDARARQWRRLQFGAGGRGGGGQVTVPVGFAGITVRTLSLASRPSPAFTIPTGFWLGKDGKGVKTGSEQGIDAFFVRLNFKTARGAPTRAGSATHLGGTAKHPTRGIEAHRFFDAGLAALASSLSIGYTNLFNAAYEDAKSQLGAQLRQNAQGTIPFTPQRVRQV